MSRANRKNIFLCLIAVEIFLSVPAFAQQAGGIRGTVQDKEFDAPLAAAQVVIAETGGKTTVTDEGSFVFGEVPPGKYTLVFSKDGYTRQVAADVVVVPGQMTDVNASLSGEFTEMEEFVVQDLDIGGNSEAGLLNLRMESPAMMDSVSSDLMSRAGAGDAAGALRLVTGATIQDGKYAVVRGLPDRYVNSQINGVRLPSADPDKRAVQLDQFPSSVIESIQVAKTFTPDQQGDASGGAVNVVLKGVPDENIMKFKVGTKYKTNVNGKDFLTYEGGGVNFLGKDDSREPQESGANWTGAVGGKHGDSPPMYDWEVTAGGKRQLGDDIKVGGLGDFYYKRDADAYDDGIKDKYWVISPGGGMTPQEGSSLFDVQQGSQEVQWGGLGVLGVETERNRFKLLYMGTQTSEDKTTLAEDTRSKEYAFPGYDPYDLNDPGNWQDDVHTAPYTRFETLEYTERTTGTLQLSGDHTIPFTEAGIPGVFVFQEPQVDWTLSKNSSSLTTPDKRMFGSYWTPPHLVVNRGRIVGTNSATYYPKKPYATANMGFVQRTWKDVQEDGDQLSLNGKIPFEQWSGSTGFFKAGFFRDTVTRLYNQDSFSNANDNDPWEGDWSEPWSDQFPSQNHPMFADNTDVDYDANQEISAWYYMVDLPLSSFFKVTGGTRYESTALDIALDPESDVKWVPPWDPSTTWNLLPGQGDVDFKQDDVLPALGFEFKPKESLVLRASYSKTVARQTFKELTPVEQTEYMGGDVFVGNPELEMSELDNYDLRMDYTPVVGSMVSVSWFRKEILNPIEYVQAYTTYTGEYIKPVNYPEGKLTGIELEFRQELGRFWDPLEGLSAGANATLIKSEVTLPENEAATLAGAGYPQPTRDMLNAPSALYNLNLTYDIEKTGTKLGLFYTIQGDTLVAGAGSGTGYVPDVYATEYGTLNFSLSQKIGEHWKLDFKAKNLLNPDIQEVYRSDYLSGDTVKTSYKKGIEYSISASYEF